MNERQGHPAAPLPPPIRMEQVDVGALRDPQLMIVKGVNWTVAAGDFWAVAGLQGSGKTDFLSLAAGLTAPAAGHYYLYGEPMPIFEDARLPARLRLGMVFDGGQLLNQLTVRENIALPLRYHHNLTVASAQDPVDRLLEWMELAEWADSTPGGLSRNWARRAGLARALTLKPDLLLIDNPLGGLDFRHSHWWLRFLQELAQGHPALDGKPATLVVTAANLRPWRTRARQFAVLRNREFIALGAGSELEAAGAELVHEFLSGME